jgi:hypothetical protein
MVRSQIGNLTPDPSFGHNLCFRYLNGSCKPTLEILVLRDFQWYKKVLNPMSFDFLQSPSEDLEVHWDSNSQSGSSLGSVRVHSLTISCTFGSIKCDFWAHSWLTPLQALTLVGSPRLGLRHHRSYEINFEILNLLPTPVIPWIAYRFVKEVQGGCVQTGNWEDAEFDSQIWSNNLL